MKNATGSPVSPDVLLAAIRRALDEIGSSGEREAASR
jgi:hypothetical protein